MDNGQLAIKLLLIVFFAAFAVFLMLPGRGARHLAIRRLVMLAVLALIVVAVVFPALINSVAHFLGVGRGTDLLLYGMIVIFVGNSILMQRRHRMVERQITQLARELAIARAPAPASSNATPSAAPEVPGAADGGSVQ
jgi:hypothetical protein